MPIDPIQTAAMLEDIQAHYAGRFEGFESDYLQAGRLRRLSRLSPAVLTEAFLAGALALSIDQSSVRRRLALAINGCLLDESAPLSVEESPAKRRAVDEKTRLPWLDEAKLRASLAKQFSRLKPGPLDKAVRAASDRMTLPVRNAHTEAVDSAATLCEAVNLVDRWLPGWSFTARCRFLSIVGRSCPVPSRRLLTTLRRLGWMPPENTTATTSKRPVKQEETWNEMLRVCEQVARLSGRAPGQVSYLLSLLAGLDPVARRAGHHGICVAKPGCATCPAKSGCLYASIHDIEPVAAKGAKNVEAPRRHTASEGDALRDKALEHGVDAMSDVELLALFLGKGTRERSPMELARSVIETFGDWTTIAGLPLGALQRIPGIGPARAAEIKAAVEIGRRTNRSPYKRGARIVEAVDVYRDSFARYRHVQQEVFQMIMLNTKHEIMGRVEVSRGTLNEALVHPRDVYKQAVAASAAAVIFTHNHPSGDPTPSQADREITLRLQDAGRLLGIKMLDHVILGDGCFYSFTDDELENVPHRE